MSSNTNNKIRQTDDLLEKFQRGAFAYFLNHASPSTGLIADNTREDSHASIAVTGFGLAAYAVGVERGFLERGHAVARALIALRFLCESPQGEEPNATGHNGFYYHFLDMKNGRRAWKCELSMIDTALLVAGILTVGMYFDGERNEEQEVRHLAKVLFERIDWKWAMNGNPMVLHGWKPECGFLNYGWEGYSEALLLYVLGLGSASHPIPPESFRAWTSTYQWENLYGRDFLFAAPLFIHQFSHLWIDFRGIQDDFMRQKGSDYFENTRVATSLQREYANRNPKRFKGYNKNCWGFTAGDGPGPAKLVVDGREHPCFGYVARGLPYGPDDGTISLSAVLASLPFATEIVLDAVRHIQETYPEILGDKGCLSSFNPSFNPGTKVNQCWVCPTCYGLDQGAVLLMIENHRSGFLWRLMRRCPVLVTGLRRAGFQNGWLNAVGKGKAYVDDTRSE